MSSTGHVHRREKFLWWQFHTPPSAVHQRPFSIFSSVSLPNHQRVFLPLRHPRPETSALCERTADFRLTFSTAGFFSLPKAPLPPRGGCFLKRILDRRVSAFPPPLPSILSFECCLFSFFPPPSLLSFLFFASPSFPLFFRFLLLPRGGNSRAETKGEMSNISRALSSPSFFFKDYQLGGKVVRRRGIIVAYDLRIRRGWTRM